MGPKETATPIGAGDVNTAGAAEEGSRLWCSVRMAQALPDSALLLQ